MRGLAGKGVLTRLSTPKYHQKDNPAVPTAQRENLGFFTVKIYRR